MSGKQKVLLIGSGAREHAIAWKLVQSPSVGELIVAPGGDWCGCPIEGSIRSEEVLVSRWNCQLNSKSAFKNLALRAKSEAVSLVVVGPDDPLALGIVNIFEDHGILVFGPREDAAQIEADKNFAKEVMMAAGVRTAEYRYFTDSDHAKDFLRSADWSRGWVVKANGLALGKGVVVCDSLDEGLGAVEKLFSISGSLVIEEKLSGREMSCFAICDGEDYLVLDFAQDFKRLQEGDRGPNTGGMGAFSPVSLPELGQQSNFQDTIGSEVFGPVLGEMKKRGRPFQGILYAGLMWDERADKPYVLEFNARFGDPEAQVLLPRMDSDLFVLLNAAAKGQLRSVEPVRFSRDHAVYVVAASSGYPQSPRKGDVIRGKLPERIERGTNFFLAGACKDKADQWRTSGGRVLGALGRGLTHEKAREQAYQNLSKIQFEGMAFRSDIGDSKASEIATASFPTAEKVRFAIFASGTGSNFDAICERLDTELSHAQCVCLLSDRENSPVLEKAKQRGIPAHAVLPARREEFSDAVDRRRAHETQILEVLSAYRPRFLVFAGYMRVIGETLLDAFRSERGYSRIINIHPSLLPSFPGKDGYGDAFRYGSKESGVTVHFVDEKVDSGPILAQRSFPISDLQSVDDVKKRGLAVEHELYSNTLSWALRERFQLVEREGRKIVLQS